MDRDKLSKAAEEYALENAWYPGETSYESDINAMQESFSDTFKRGADWLMQQPLADRLTDTEKEKIREIYWQAAKDWIGIGDARGHCKTCIAIESIFGTDLFKEK